MVGVLRVFVWDGMHGNVGDLVIGNICGNGEHIPAGFTQSESWSHFSLRAPYNGTESLRDERNCVDFAGVGDELEVL